MRIRPTKPLINVAAGCEQSEEHQPRLKEAASKASCSGVLLELVDLPRGPPKEQPSLVEICLPIGNLHYFSRCHSQVDSLEVGSFHTPPI